MTLFLLIVIFLLPILSGGMFVHLLWPERDFKILFFKTFLGIGLGLGLWSLLYFLYMLFFAGGHWFIFVQLAIFSILLIVTIWKESKQTWLAPPRWNLTRAQTILSAIALVVFLISLASTASYLLRRKQGDWDAWMMYNRAARFVYRDQSNWLESFSRQMDPIFHADYPLLLAMNTASGWDALSAETPRVPMIQSALFAAGLLGLAVGALASIKSTGQAALGAIILWGTPALVNEGARELADVPLAFFMLATVVLIYFYVLHKKPALIAMAGFSAGLAAWTKNEGSLFVVSAGIALAVAFLFTTETPSHRDTKKENLVSSRLRDLVVKIRSDVLPVLFRYTLGLAFPFAITLYFKLFLAPPSDVLSNGAAKSFQQILDISRHAEIIKFFWNQFMRFGSWTGISLAIGVFPILLIYFLLFRSPIRAQHRRAYIAGLTILAVQALGDYAVYLITPYNLAWHLGYSGQRIVLQVFPLITFLILAASRTPESVFDGESAQESVQSA